MNYTQKHHRLLKKLKNEIRTTEARKKKERWKSYQKLIIPNYPKICNRKHKLTFIIAFKGIWEKIAHTNEVS